MRKLSELLREAGVSCTLVSDGAFDGLEQCTRVRGSHALTFLENPKYAAALENPSISCVICTPEVQAQLPAHITGIAVTNAPKALFFRLHNHLVEQRALRPTVIDPSARISPQAYVAPYNVVIGKNVEIEPFAVINENSTLQEDVRVCSGTVIGAQGYTVVKEGEAEAFIVRDAGSTVVERGVQIGSNCIIERGTLPHDTTKLGACSMLDNSVTLGHGTTLGRRVLIAGGAVISGNCVLGDQVWVGVNATVSNVITIGSGARVSLGAVVTKDVPDGATVTGNFAIDHQKFLRNLKESIKE